MRRFRCIAMDPPWPERGAGKCKRGADRHYKLSGKKAIRDVILGAEVWRPATHAHLYMWVTNNYLLDGLWLVDQLGFRYVTNLCWAKPRYGLGQYWRHQHELLLFAVRGQGQHPSVMTKRRDLSSLVGADHMRDEKNRRIHSAKPHEFYDLIEARTKGPRVELFARGGARPGWQVWGDEAIGE